MHIAMYQHSVVCCHKWADRRSSGSHVFVSAVISGLRSGRGLPLPLQAAIESAIGCARRTTSIFICDPPSSHCRRTSLHICIFVGFCGFMLQHVVFLGLPLYVVNQIIQFLSSRFCGFSLISASGPPFRNTEIFINIKPIISYINFYFFQQFIHFYYPFPTVLSSILCSFLLYFINHFVVFCWNNQTYKIYT